MMIFYSKAVVIQSCHTQCRTKRLIVLCLRQGAMLCFYINDVLILNFDHPVYLLFLEECAVFNILTTLEKFLHMLFMFDNPFSKFRMGKFGTFCGMNGDWKQ